MAERAEEPEQEEPWSVAELTTEIVVAYFTKNTIAMADLGELIGAVAPALGSLGREQAEPVKPEPAVPVRRSIRDEHLTCLVCGKQLKTLRRHLDVAHQLTPEAYREQFRLRPDYPTPRWPSAWAWDSARRLLHDAGSRAAARDPQSGDPLRYPRRLAPAPCRT